MWPADRLRSGPRAVKLRHFAGLPGAADYFAVQPFCQTPGGNRAHLITITERRANGIDIARASVILPLALRERCCSPFLACCACFICAHWHVAE